MPRANRYLLPGQFCHITHRCHNRALLLRCVRDRDEYRLRLRAAATAHGVAVLTYCITSNHVHIVAGAASTATIAGMMQQLEGEFARSYNRRKRRGGAFWEGRYHATMIERGAHLWNCMVYVDLNMVRAGVVSHPRAWAWCGYQELTNRRKRYRLVDTRAVHECMLETKALTLADYYEECIARGLEADAIRHASRWTESIAVGSQHYVNAVAEQERQRTRLAIEKEAGDCWCLRDNAEPYGRFFGAKQGCKPLKFPCADT